MPHPKIRPWTVGVLLLAHFVTHRLLPLSLALTAAILVHGCLSPAQAQTPPQRPLTPADAPSGPHPGGWGWGLGVAFSDNLFGDDLVEPGDVTIDSQGLVRVRRVRNVAARFVFETHHTIPVSQSVALGPFVAIEPGADLLTAAGAGIMVEIQRERNQPSMQLGIGVMVDFDRSRLAAGWVDGQPAPTATPQFISREEAALLVLITISP